MGRYCRRKWLSCCFLLWQREVGWKGLAVSECEHLVERSVPAVGPESSATLQPWPGDNLSVPLLKSGASKASYLHQHPKASQSYWLPDSLYTLEGSDPFCTPTPLIVDHLLFAFTLEGCLPLAQWLQTSSRLEPENFWFSMSWNILFPMRSKP